jgi:hypothetical protein
MNADADELEAERKARERAEDALRAAPKPNGPFPIDVRAYHDWYWRNQPPPKRERQ